MMDRDMTDLRVLYIGGMGTISTSCVRLSLECGMRVYGLNRGNNRAARVASRGGLAESGRHRRGVGSLSHRGPRF